MVDIHSHIIPRIDDGVQSEEAAIELISREGSGGTRTIIATPHVQSDKDITDSPQIPQRLDALRELLRQSNVNVEVVPGAELYPSKGILRGLDEGLPVTLAGKGKHVLVDLPMSFFPMDMDEILFEIQSRGVTPILAHPERSGPFQENPKRLEEYVRRGVACQVNARSLRGKYGPRAEECAFMFLNARLAHFLASDAHAPRPQPILAAAKEDLGDEIDEAYWTLLTVTSGACVLNGETLPTLPEAPIRERKTETKKGWLQRILKR